MERQLPQPFLFQWGKNRPRRSHGGQASALDKGRPATPAIKHSVILATLSAAAMPTTHTAWMSIRF